MTIADILIEKIDTLEEKTELYFTALGNETWSLQVRGKFYIISDGQSTDECQTCKRVNHMTDDKEQVKQILTGLIL